MMVNLLDRLENLIFGLRPLIVGIFVTITLIMGYGLTNLHVDAGFSKHLPLQHEYMQTFMEYRNEFGGANRVLVALRARDGNMFSAEFFNALKQATDEVFFLDGVDRSRVSSLFTPNVRFTEVVEDGIAGGNVVPADFQPTVEGLDQVRKNILKSSIVGRLVANDFSAAIISAELIEFDPQTGEKVDVIEVGHQLEALREKITAEVQAAYDAKSADVGADMRKIEKQIMLQVLDTLWKEHLATMDHLRQGIHLRAYAQKNPKQEYKREAFEMFSGMLDAIKQEVVSVLTKVQVQTREEMYPQQVQQQDIEFQHEEFSGFAEEESQPSEQDIEEQHTPFVRTERKVGRNEPCPCGSGKKYKQCHGRIQS